MRSSRSGWLRLLGVFLVPVSIGVVSSGIVYAAKPAVLTQGRGPVPFVVPQPAPGPWGPGPFVVPQPVPRLRLAPNVRPPGFTPAGAATPEDRCLFIVPEVDPGAIVPVRTVDGRAIVPPKVVGAPVRSRVYRLNR